MESLLKLLLPFSNEIANALTISREPGFERLYIPCTHNWTELEHKTIVDVLALTGIIWNVSAIGAMSGVYAGLATGCMLISVAFIIPNICMEYFVESFCENKEEEIKCSHGIKLVIALIFIFLLLLCEHVLSYLLGKVDWKKKIS